MTIRLASAAVGLPILLAAVWVGPPWFSAFVFIVTLAATYELTRLVNLWGERRVHWAFPVVLAACFVSTGHQWGANGEFPLAEVLIFVFKGSARYVAVGLQVVILLGFCLMIRRLLLEPDRRFGIPDDSLMFAVPAYIGVPVMYALALRGPQHAMEQGVQQGFEWMLLTLLTVFATDTAAFFGGRAFGKTPLAPNISPNKTREGAVAGMCGAVAASAISANYLKIDAIIWETLILGVIIGALAQLGDLVESRMKRKAGVKDSGVLMPGHGGILDRLDSIVFTMPAVYYFVIWEVQQRGLLS